MAFGGDVCVEKIDFLGSCCRENRHNTHVDHGDPFPFVGHVLAGPLASEGNAGFLKFKHFFFFL